MMPIIQADKVNKSFGSKKVLDDVSFAMQAGESMGIIGPNGSGKTTLLHIMSGVEAFDKGDVRFRGRPLKKISRKEIARSIAVLQQDALPPVSFSVREVIKMGRFPFQTWFGEDEAHIDDLIEGILSKMSLTHLQDRELSQLSGGERQRVALAKTMVQSPRLIMLDEPTTYLDIGHQIHLMDQIHAWQNEEKLTMISVLHDLNLAALYCEKLMLVHQGKIIKIGKPKEIIQADLIESVYGIRPIILEHPTLGVPQIILQSEDEAKVTYLSTKKA